MPITRYLSRPHLQIALAYLASYVALDWLSFVHPIGSLGITPWNPHPGLSFALILLFGREYLPWLFVAPLLADAVVRGSPLPVWADIGAALIIAVGYGTASSVLISRFIHFDVTLATKRDLLLLVAAVTIAAAFVATAYVALAAAAGSIEPSQFLQAVLRYWIGDTIGIIVVAPFALVLFTRRRFPGLSSELLGPFVLLLLGLWLVVGVEAFRFQLFYLLFLPVIWTAVRFGFEVLTLALAATQLGLIAAIHFSGQSAIDVTAFQAMMVVLALTGLAVGVIVSEQQRTQHRLRVHQDALARLTRLNTMGQFAATLAHEINQPLTAIANYTRLANDAAQTPSGNMAVVTEATAKAVEQVDRVAEVIRRLRELIRIGHGESAPISVEHAISQVSSLIRTELEQHGIAIDIKVPRGLPKVSGDALQLEQVILNLIRNAVDSIVGAGRYDGRITLSAQHAPPGFVTIHVSDNGPGFDPDLADEAIAPFTTTKPDGMGLGLSLCRSIIEAHRGKLWVGGDATGAIVSFTLPVAQT
jgi:signal transduction histidine kinase